MRFGVELLGDGLLGGFHGDELLIVEGCIHRRGMGPLFRPRPVEFSSGAFALGFALWPRGFTAASTDNVQIWLP